MQMGQLRKTSWHGKTIYSLSSGRAFAWRNARLLMNQHYQWWPSQLVPPSKHWPFRILGSTSALPLGTVFIWKLDLSDQSGLYHKTRDHLAVWPSSPNIEAERLLHTLGLADRRNIPISIKSVDPTVKVKIPTPTTPDALFRYYLEICGPISRDSILSLAQFAPNPTEKTYLTALSRDKSIYADFLSRNQLNIGRLLEISTGGDPSTTWSKLPLSYLIEILPRTQPCYYSTTSSSVLSLQPPSMTALVSTSPLPNAPTSLIHGLATNYLLALSQSLTASSRSHIPPYRSL